MFVWEKERYVWFVLKGRRGKKIDGCCQGDAFLKL